MLESLSDVLGALSRARIQRRAISNLAVLNEAFVGPNPRSYSRGLRIDADGLAILLISGTFSSDEQGNVIHVNDFRGQMRRTLNNITGLLAAEGCTWHDVVRTTCYLRDIDRDYQAFNEERTAFFSDQKLSPLPASTGIQATLFRPELLVEIEAIAMFRTKGKQIMPKNNCGTEDDSKALPVEVHVPLDKRAVTDLSVLNEAYAYAKPSSFSRGMRIDLNGVTILLISGTASIDEHGNSIHIGDFRAQMQRTFKNISGLLQSEGAGWHDIVRTTCYLRDIDRDYAAFNEERTAFYTAQGISPLPASTAIEVTLCRPELLIEIEAIAMFRTQLASGN